MNLMKSGLILILAGFAMVLIGTLFSTQKANIGGLIMIGPIPIAFGTSPGITVFAMVIGLIMILLMYFLGRKNV